MVLAFVFFRLVSMVIFGYDARFIEVGGVGVWYFVTLKPLADRDVQVAGFVGI